MPEKRKPISFQKYIFAFCFTVVIFALGFFASNYINNRRFSEINTMRQEFQIQVLALETQLAHFKDILCADIGDDILTHELHVIGEKLEFMENSLGQNHTEVIHLKKYYFLLQIRHHQLSEQLSQRCGLDLVHILYFHADQEDCPDCKKQGSVLSFLREEYPLLRIYSFDYNFGLTALDVIRPLPQELVSAPVSEDDPGSPNLPIIVIEGKPFYGFRDIQAMKEILPERVFADSRR